MSLLLDALKKAAEQKAEKGKQEVAPASKSDETLIDAAEDVSVLDDSTDVKLPSEHQIQDETEIDNSEIETRLEQTVLERDPGDETGLDVAETTETRVPSASAQMQTGEDETIIFADDDVADFMGEPKFVEREQRPAEDETDLSQLVQRDDQTDIGQRATQAEPAREDDTDISQPFQPGDQTDFREAAPVADETDIAAPAVDETDIAAPAVDETDIGEPAVAADETDFRDQVGAEDETDISEPIATVEDLKRVAALQASAEDTDLSRAEMTSSDADVSHAEPVPDDDLSLLLVERDQTNLTDLTNPTSLTDPQRPQDQYQAMRSDSAGAEELELVDMTQSRTPRADQTETVAAPTETGATATTGINYDTQNTTRRAEATSTRTYAPDNYDRTLMRLPSEDSSKLFAGMKSDSDVVMTPDYAKKVFRSKSSAQRVQHYKIYAGIAVVILLSIGIFGLFEFQEQSNSIDLSLEPLKRDPMPGVIRSDQAESSANLFQQVEPEPGVSERTISIIESAEQIDGETEADMMAAADQELSADVDAGKTQAEVESESTPPQEVSQSESQSGVIAAESEAPASSGVTVAAVTSKAEPDTAAEPAPADSSSSLQISSSARIQDKDRWLREAYQAYRAGNDEQALKLYNRVLEVDPGNRNALLARAAINVQNNNVGDAVDDYQALLLANPKDSLAMSSLITVANYSPRETETRLKLMIREEPNSPYLNFALANAFGAQDRWMEAQGHYFTALQNNPGDPNYAYNLAVSLEHIAQPKAAMSYYQRALDNMENGLATFNQNLVSQRLEVLGRL